MANSIILNSKGHRVEAPFVNSIISGGGIFPGSIVQWSYEDNILKFVNENATSTADTMQKMVLIDESLFGKDFKEKNNYRGTAMCMMRGDSAWCLTSGISIDAGGIGTSCRVSNGELVTGTAALHSVDVARVIGLGKTIDTQNWHPVQFY